MSQQSFAERLRTARSATGLSQKDAASELQKRGVSISSRSLADYETDVRAPNEIKRDQILRGLAAIASGDRRNLVADTSLAAPGDRVVGLSAPAHLVESLQETVTLTLYTHVCAGDGVLVFDEASRISVSLPPALAFHLFGFQPPPVLGVSEVVGDSMVPMFEPGDLVLYDLTPDADGGGVFVINYEGKAACKRVQPVGRSYRLIPENRMAGYVPELIRWHEEEGFIHDETGESVEFGIVGRILFPRPETPRLHIQQVRQLLTDMFRDAALSRVD